MLRTSSRTSASAPPPAAPPAEWSSSTTIVINDDDDDDKGGANGYEYVAQLPSSKKRKRNAAGRGGRSAPPRRADDDVVEVEEVLPSSNWARGGGRGRGRQAGWGGGGGGEDYEDEDFRDGDWGRPPPPRVPAGGRGSSFSQIMGFLAAAFQGGGSSRGGLPPQGMHAGGGGVGWGGGGAPTPQCTAEQLQAMPPAQRLRSLQAMGREFTPEDYELLSMLDEKPAAAADDMAGALVQSRLARLPLSRMPDRRKGKRAGVKGAREEEVIHIASQGGGGGEVIALDESVEEAEGGHELCPICREDLPPGSVVKSLPCCLQAFHNDCIEQWFAVSHGRCPVCKADMLQFT